MRIFISVLLIALFSLNLEGQRTCGTDEITAELNQTNPVLSAQLEKRRNERLKRIKSPDFKRKSAVATVPVHVIIVHPPGQAIGTGDNFSFDHVMSQIDVMNDDFTASNNDYDDCPDVFDQGDPDIEFCLATQDPDGNATDGITRVPMNFTMSFGNQDDISEPYHWDVDSYLNIYVANLTGGLLGWAFPPGAANPSYLDGIVCLNSAFGGPGYGTANNYDEGRTVTHEAGHYFDLAHVWGSGSGGCGMDDGFDDTPLQTSSNFGCPNHPSPSCGNGGDMFMNYMDYVNDACMVTFSEEQSFHMQDVLDNERSGLASSNGCDAATSQPVAIDLDNSTDPLCNGNCDGVIEVVAEDGDGDYTFTIDGNNANSNGVFEDLCEGTYTLMVEDGDGETDEIEVTLFEPEALIVSVSNTLDILCFDELTGEIELDVSGGSEDFTVFLNGDDYGDDTFISGLAANTYEIIVVDDNGCEATSSATLDQPEALTAMITAQSNPLCFGYDDGTVNITAEGGASNYLYSSDGTNFQSAANFTGLTAGDYDFIIEDGNGCTIVLTANLVDPAPIDIAATDLVDQIDCFGEMTGSVSFQGSNTIAPYTYSIDGINYFDEGTFENLSAGSYTLYVQDGNACINTTEVIISEPNALELSAEIEAPISCNGAANGMIALIVAGGTSNYNFYLNDLSNPVGDLIDDLGPGDYNFIVVDANGCETSAPVMLTEPTAIDINTLNITEVECFGDETGSASFAANGGSGSFSYSVDGDTNDTGIFTDMTSGTYTLLVTDNNSCTESLIFDIGQTSTLLLDVTIDSDNLCAGDQNGAFTLEGMGGNGNYQYSLDGINFNDQNTFTNLSGGIYDVFVIDDNDCITINSAIINAPETITLESNQIGEILCFEDETGVITIDAEGGSGEFTFTLGTESNSTGTFMNLPSGSFLVSVSDSNGCSESIEYTIEAPDQIVTSSVAITNNTCEGQTTGQLNATATGGTAPLSYELDGATNNTGSFTDLTGGTYSLVITDANNCSITEMINIANEINLSLTLQAAVSPTCSDTEDGSITVMASGGNGNYTYSLAGESNMTGVFENLIAGPYLIEVEDPMGCSTTLEVEVVPVPLINLDQAIITDVLCGGLATGSIEINADGGSGQLTFELNGVSNTDGYFENLTAGEYDLIVMDENGCESVSEFTIEEPSPIVLMNSSSTFIDCFGNNTGQIEIEATGGTGNLSYSINGQGANESGLFNNLAAGSYQVLISDDNNCEVLELVNIEQSPEIITNIQQITHVDCNGNATGLIELNSVGGDNNHSYFLNGQESQIGAYFNLAGGSYTVQVQDGQGCQVDYVFEIEEPNELVVQPTVTDATADLGGTIQVNPMGGTEPYDITLADGSSADANNSFNDLAEGFYTVQVTDANGCMTELEVEVRLENLYADFSDGITINEVLCPNPAKDIITLKLESTSDQYILLDFYDDIGQFIKYQSFFATAGENTVEMDISDFPPSGYILRVQSTRDYKHMKFIKVE